MNKVYVIGMREKPRTSGIGRMANTGDIMTCVSVEGKPYAMSLDEAKKEIAELRETESGLYWAMVWPNRVSVSTLIEECGL